MSIFLALPLLAHTPGTVCSQWCHTACCEANGTPGCNDPACQTIMCQTIPGCCDIAWDAGCATIAQILRPSGTCP